MAGQNTFKVTYGSDFGPPELFEADRYVDNGEWIDFKVQRGSQLVIVARIPKATVASVDPVEPETAGA